MVTHAQLQKAAQKALDYARSWGGLGLLWRQERRVHHIAPRGAAQSRRSDQWKYWILLSTSDEAGREEAIAWICTQPGLNREKAEIFLDALHRMFPDGASSVPAPSLEVVVAYARPVAEVLAENNVFGVRREDD